MHNFFVRAGLLALTLVAWTEPLEAQLGETRARPLRFGIGVGGTIPSGYVLDLPTDLGFHGQLSAAWRRSPKVVLRLDGLANSLASTAAIPSCIPGVPCETLVPHPNQVYSATVAAELRRMSGADQLFLLLGAGAYHARGTDSKSFGTTAGGVLGFGVDLASPTRAGFSIEVRYHYLPNNFGTLTGLLTPSLMFRF